METTTASAASGRGTTTGLAVIASAQLLIVLDATIVNIALPSAQQALGIPDAGRQWVAAAYLLAFGGLLLLGGRIADFAGPKRTFTVSIVGFALASAVAGTAVSPGMLIGARAVQGAFAAALAPSTLSLLTSTFTDPQARSRAFGIYAAVSGGGAALGLLAGGVLTEFLSWRWCLYVSVPIALLTLWGALRSLAPAPRKRPEGFDVPGVLTSGIGMTALVLTVSEAESAGPTAAATLVTAAVAVVGFVAFAVRERSTAHPMLPLRLLGSPFRLGALAVVVLVQIAMFGFYLFMTYYLQTVLGYPPVLAGLAFLPVAAAISFGATVIVGRVAPRVSTRALVVPGALACAVGFGLLVLLVSDPGSPYLEILLPAQILIGIGMGCSLVPAFERATAGVAPARSGVVSAVVNAAEQSGGAFGTALFNSVAVAVATGAVASGAAPTAATVDGFAVGMAIGAVFLVLAALVGTVLLRPGLEPARDEHGDDDGADRDDAEVAEPEPAGR